MRDVPQLKFVREDQGWSQRDLAARSGVAQNTISQLERGERKAMPSTIRKLADALRVVPPMLMRQPGRQPIAPKDREAQPSGQGVSFAELSWKSKEEARARKEWYETARWAEYYVSGEAINREKALLEDEIAQFKDQVDEPLTEEQIAAIFPAAGERHLSNIIPARISHPEDLVVARSRLGSGNPKETIEAAQIVLRRAKKIVEEYERKLQSFRRIPEHYYADPTAHSRILRLEEVLSKQREAAAEDVQELMDLYDECLDTLEAQILGMRKESDVLEAFVTQAQDQER
jgi:transcriptional regulator with XRE-family HTH domain